MADAGNGNGNGKSAAAIANSVIAILVTRAMTVLGLPAIGYLLYWIAATVATDHDTLTRIDATISAQAETLRGHDLRIRTIEEAHRAGVP